MCTTSPKAADLDVDVAGEPATETRGRLAAGELIIVGPSLGRPVSMARREPLLGFSPVLLTAGCGWHLYSEATAASTRKQALVLEALPPLRSINQN
jgi:hypothetical protein